MLMLLSTLTPPSSPRITENTATEVTPIRSVDRIPVGGGTPGPVTRAIQTRFLETVKGTAEDTHGWLTYV